MKKYMKLLIGVVALIVVLGGSYVLYNYLMEEYGDQKNLVTEQDDVENSNQEKAAAIDFTVIDQTGQERSLLSFKGKPIILNFWASWCGPCKREFPDFQTAYEQYGEEIEFVMVNVTDGARETKETASAYIESEGYTLPIYFDITEEAANSYAIYSLPTTYYIDKDGYIVATAQGMLDSASLQKGIAMIQ